MADDKISSSIEIDVSSAKANVNALNREIRLLDSEFKAATGGMNDWAGSISGNEAKIAQLNGTIEAHQQKIANLTVMYNEAVAAQGEHSAAAENLAIKINQEQAALAANQAELQEVTTRLAELQGAAEGAGEGMGGLAEDASESSAGLESAGSGADSLADKLKTGLEAAAVAAAAALAAVGAAAKEALEAVWGFASDVGKSADDINTLSQQTGIATESLQQWAYASQFIDTPVESITGSMRRLTQQMGNAESGSKSAIAAFETLGVSIADKSGNLRDSEAVFWDIIGALGEMGNEAERDSASMAIFGKSAQDLNPLILAGRDAWQAYCDEASRLGLVMDESQLALANGFDDANNKFKSVFDGLKNAIGLEAIPAFQQLLTTATETASGVLQALQDGFQEGDMDAIVEVLSGGLEDAAGQLSGIVETLLPVLMTVIDSLISGAAEALPGLLPPLIETAVNALVSIAEHLPEIVSSILTALAGVDWVSVGGDVMSGIVSALFSAIGNIPDLVSSLAGLFAGIASGLWEAIKGILPDWLLDIFGGSNSGIQLNSAFTGTNVETAVNQLADRGVVLDDGQVAQLYQEMAQSYMDQVLAAAGVSFDQLSEETQNYLNEIMEDMQSGESGWDVGTLIAEMGNAIAEDENLQSQGIDLGSNFSSGLAEGILANAGAITAAVASVCNMAVSEAQAMLDIHSPSRVTRDIIGKQFGAGIAQGITDSVSGIERSVAAAGAAAVGTLAGATGGNSFSVTNNVQASIRSEADIDLLAARLAARNKRIARGYAV